MTSYHRWYRNGTISVEAGATTVHGSQLAWTNQAVAGDTLLIRSGPNAGLLLEVAADPVQDLVLAIDTPWPGVTQAGLAYAIIPTSVKRGMATDIHAAITNLRASLLATYKATSQPSDSLGAPGSLAIDAAQGRLWIKGDTSWGAPIAFAPDINEAETLALIAGVRGGASAAYDTLKKLEDKVAPILAGSSAAYDTFAEISAYIAADQSAAAAVNTALANRVRVDAAQGLAAGQQAQARANIGAASNVPADAIVFLASGTYTKPAGLVAVRVTVVGGGGGGGGAIGTSGSVAVGGGGGGGGAAIRWIPASSLGATVAVTVGAGGAGGVGTGGSAGGTSSFGAFLSATGGGFGGHYALATAPTWVTGGAGGAGSGGDVSIVGGAGVTGKILSTAVALGGEGGASIMGGGARNNNGAGNGITATGRGGGGSGADKPASGSTTRTGGAGADGIVIVEEVF